MSLKDPTQKMSKSHPDPRSRILLNDSYNEIHAKVRQALTDSEVGISWAPDRRPGVSNLLEIAAALGKDGEEPIEVAKRYQNSSMREFKEGVADTINQVLDPIRTAFERLMQPAYQEYLDEIASNGARQADSHSRPVLEEVCQKVGLR